MLANMIHLADGKMWQLAFWGLLTLAFLIMSGRACGCVAASQAIPRQKPRTKADRVYFFLTILFWMGLAMMAAVCFADIMVNVKPVLRFVNLRNYGFGVAIIGIGLILLLRFEVPALYMVPHPGAFRQILGRAIGFVAIIAGIGFLLVGVSADGLKRATVEAAMIVQAMKTGLPVTP